MNRIITKATPFRLSSRLATPFSSLTSAKYPYKFGGIPASKTNNLIELTKYLFGPNV